MLLCSILIFGLATVLGGLIKDMNQLLILRFIDGIGIGGAIPTATTLLAEFSPARRRSRAVIIGLTCIPVGVFIGGFIGSVILPAFGWRILFVINGVLAILVGTVFLIYLPESPRFLALKPNRREELRSFLKRLGFEIAADANWVDVYMTKKKGVSLQALFAHDSLRTTLFLWGGFFFCFLATYTSLSWMPAMLSSRGYSLSVSSLALSASGVGGIVASLATSKLVELFGSRNALLFPSIAVILSATALIMMPLDPSLSAIPVLLAIGMLGLSLNSLTALIYSLGAFVYPPIVRGAGLGSSGAFGRFGAIVSSFTAVAVLALGTEAFFAFIAVSALISVVFIFFIKKQIPNDVMMQSDEMRLGKST